MIDYKQFYTVLWPLLLLVVLVFNNSWVEGMFMDGNLYAALAKNAVLENRWIVPKLSGTYFSNFFEHPPLYFILQGLSFKIFGISWTSARLLNLFLTILSLLTVWKICNEYFNARIAQLASFLYVFSYPLIKLARFPNLEMAIVLITLLIVYLHLKGVSQAKVPWIKMGLLLGLGFLVKGHAIFFLPLVILIDLIIRKDKLAERIMRYMLGLVIALMVFGLWPLALYLQGEIEGFNFWFNRQFTQTVVEGRGNLNVNYFMYIQLLLKNAFYTFLPALFLFRNQNDIKKYSILFAWILGILVPYSFLKFKLGHYIAPIYPALAIASAIFISEKININPFKFSTTVKYLTVTISLALLCFPLTNRPRRDIELISILNFVESQYEGHSKITMDITSYPIWNFVNLVSFKTNLDPYHKALDANDSGLVISKLKSIAGNEPVYKTKNLNLFILGESN